MSEVVIGIRDFKAHMGRYLRRVKAGESLVITARGEPIGRIIPAALPTSSDTSTDTPVALEAHVLEAHVLEAHVLEAHVLKARVAAIIEAGLAEWNGQPYMPGEPVAVNRGPRCVSDLLVEDREPEWWAYALPGAQP